MQKVNLGDEFQLYLDPAKSETSPAWVHVTCIEDLGLDSSPITAQINKRGAKTPKYKRGRLDTMVSFKLLDVPANSEFVAIENAIWDDTNDGTEILHLAIVRGDMATAGNAVWSGFFVVGGAPLDPSLDEGASYDVECKPAADSDAEFTRGVS